MSIERLPELGRKPVSLTVKLPPIKGQGADLLTEGLRELYRRGDLADVELLCEDRTFNAHRAVLAAQSKVFRTGFHAPPSSGKTEVRLQDICNPEAVKFMLDYLYQMDASMWEDYNPRTQEINKDILRLARNFKLPGMTERAMHWLARDLSTANVVERLTICQDFGLTELKEKILEQLTFNRRALAEVASSPQITAYPELMQAMLQLAAAAPEDIQQGPQKKKGRKA